jgi:type I restriction enzyme S subunit
MTEANSAEARSELPEGWKWDTIGDACLVVDKIEPARSPHQAFRYIDISAIDRTTNTIGDVQPVLGEAAPSRARQLVKAGDVLVSTVRPNLQTIALVPPEFDGEVASTGFCVLRPGRGLAERWLFYWTLSPVLLESLLSKARGVSYPAVLDKDVRAEPIPLPPIDEQRRIVQRIDDRLDAIADGNEALRTAGSRIGGLRASILKGAVAMGEEKTLGDVLEGIEAGKSFRCHGHPAPDDSWGVIKVSAMTWGDFRPQENKEVIDEAVVDERWEIRNGDLLISRANTSAYVGATVLVRKTRSKLLLSDKSLRLIPKTAEVSGAWLSHALNAPLSRKQMSIAATGTSDSMRNLSQDKIKALRLRVPELAVQEDLARRIEAEMGAAAQIQEAVARQLKASDSLRRSVLRDAMDGRLPLGDVRVAA